MLKMVTDTDFYFRVPIHSWLMVVVMHANVMQGDQGIDIKYAQEFLFIR
jgi:hypothetical protein